MTVFADAGEFREVMDRTFGMMASDPDMGPKLRDADTPQRIEFCDPIDVSGYGRDAADDRALVFELSEQVREVIQAKLYENLVKRGSAFV